MLFIKISCQQKNMLILQSSLIIILILAACFFTYYLTHTKYAGNIRITLNDKHSGRGEKIIAYGISPLGNHINFRKTGCCEWDHLFSRTFGKIIIEIPPSLFTENNKFEFVVKRSDAVDTLYLSKNQDCLYDIMALTHSKISYSSALLFPFRLCEEVLLWVFISFAGLLFALYVFKRRNTLFYYIQQKRILVVTINKSINIKSRNKIQNGFEVCRKCINILKEWCLKFAAVLKKYTGDVNLFLVDMTSAVKYYIFRFISGMNESIKKIKIQDILLIVTVTFSVIFLLKSVLLICSKSLNIGGTEEYFIVFLQNYIKTGVLYPPDNIPPFDTNYYLPIYFVLMKWISVIMNMGLIDIGNYRIVYFIGRIISFVSLLSSIYIIFRILHKLLGVNKKTSVISSLIILILLPSLYIAVRPDSMRLLFFISAVYFTIKYLLNSKIKHLVLLSLFTGMAIAVKQDTAALGLSVFLTLLVYKKYKHLFLFTCISSVIFLLFTLPFLKISLLAYFTGLATTEGFSVSYFKFVMLPYFIKISPFIICLVFICYKWLKHMDKISFFLLSMMFLSFIVGLPFSLKIGGGFHYYKFFEITGIIIITYFFTRSGFRFKRGYLSVFVLILFIPYLMYSVFYLNPNIFGVSVMNPKINYSQNNTQITNCKEIYDFMTRHLKLKNNEYILLYPEELFVFFPYNYVVDVNKLYQLRILYSKIPLKIVDIQFAKNNQHLKEFIDKGKVKYLITYKGYICDNFIKTKHPDFCPMKELSGYKIYKYKANIN